MELKCGKCNHVINIPDGKVPSGKAFTVHCPKCKSSVTSTPDDTIDLSSIGAPPTRQKTADVPDAGSDVALEFSHEGEQLALVCSDKLEKEIKSALSAIGCRTSFGESAEKAIKLLRYNDFNIIIVHENFDKSTVKTNKFLQHIKPMPMASRRSIFVALIGPEFKTFDEMASFVHSVNVVISEKEIGNLKNILSKSLNDFKLYYKVFFETLEEAGKI